MNLIRPFADRSLLIRVALACGIFALAVAARFAMLPTGGLVVFATFYPATVLAFYLCGAGPGMLFVVLSALSACYLVSSAASQLTLDRFFLIALGSYLASSALIGWIVRSLQNTFLEYGRTLVALSETSTDLQDLYDHSPCGYYSLDPDGRYLQINDLALSWLECSAEDVIGKCRPSDFLSDESKEIFRTEFPRFKVTGQTGPHELEIVGRKGTRRRVSMSATAVKDKNGNFIKSRTVVYDISELHAARQSLQQLNKEQGMMLDNELIGMIKLRNRKTIWKNRAIDSIFGYEPHELVNQSSRHFYLDEESYLAIGEAAYPVLARGGTYRTQAVMARKDGIPIWLDISGVQLSKESGESLWLMVDITQMKQYQSQVESIAFKDALTGLANRHSLLTLLHQALARCDRTGEHLAVCFIDLDGFKSINDSYGHDAGDRVLKSVAIRLRAIVRGSDFAARLGGDEFVFAFTLQSREEYSSIADRLTALIAEPIGVAPDRFASVAASVGTAFYPGDGKDAEALLRHADQEMFKNKRAQPSRRLLLAAS